MINMNNAMKLPDNVLNQIRNNQARRRGLLALENCTVCGLPCNPATETIITSFRTDSYGVTMHKTCQTEEE